MPDHVHRRVVELATSQSQLCRGVACTSACDSIADFRDAEAAVHRRPASITGIVGGEERKGSGALTKSYQTESYICCGNCGSFVRVKRRTSLISRPLSLTLTRPCTRIVTHLSLGFVFVRARAIDSQRHNIDGCIHYTQLGSGILKDVKKINKLTIDDCDIEACHFILRPLDQKCLELSVYGRISTYSSRCRAVLLS